MSDTITTLNPNPPKQKNVLRTGFILLGISLLFFLFTLNGEFRNGDFFNGSFIVCGILFVIYFFIVVGSNLAKYGKRLRFKNLKYNIILLQMANISAYALNRVIPIFNESVEWLCVYIVLSNLALIAFILRDNHKTNWLNHVIVLLTASGIIFHLYQSIYIAPVYPFALMAFWFFGIPLHAFVPIWFFITSIIIVRKYLKVSPDYWKTCVAGMVIPLLFVALFSVRWGMMNRQINNAFHSQNTPLNEQELPDWVRVSQDLRKDWVSKRILKNDLVYATANRWGRRFGRINETRKHDPLVMTASLFAGELELSADDRITVLNSLYNQRHQTERKLWRGDKLSTTDIVTNVQLFPEHRLAYTEKTFKIHNRLKKNERWRRQQEALYTFYLPEGSVVTSAALWVEGEERPAYLTTKSKADKAYTQIVGRERRDPLLLHWQEGNRVTVRVFPCTPAEDRQFKIGVTTPLLLHDDELVYENIDFQGPDWHYAKESINVIAEGDIADLSTPFSFREDGNSWNYKGRYKSDWTLKFDAPPVSTHDFSFNGKRYDMVELQAEISDFSAQEIYLDINNGWSKKELLKLWKNISNREVYVYTNHLEKVSEGNHKRLFKKLLRRNFSLFPFHKINNPNNALVITKNGTRLTPVLDDIKKSTFATNLNEYLKQNATNVKLFNLDDDLSPYLKSLKELRVFDYANGDINELSNYLNKNIFQYNSENNATVANHYSNTIIRETISTTKDSTARGAAPDHLMRMYAYNDLMRKVGRGYFDKKQLEKQFVDAAKEAYVVTPVSSLVVLETQADYDRFDIKKAKNSLQNAKIKNSGSVPEPGEWLLIILSLLVAIVVTRASGSQREKRTN